MGDETEWKMTWFDLTVAMTRVRPWLSIPSYDHDHNRRDDPSELAALDSVLVPSPVRGVSSVFDAEPERHAAGGT